MTFVTPTHMECTGTAPSLVDFAVSSLFTKIQRWRRVLFVLGLKSFNESLYDMQRNIRRARGFCCGPAM